MSLNRKKCSTYQANPVDHMRVVSECIYLKIKTLLPKVSEPTKNIKSPQAFKAFVSEKLKKVDMANKHTHASSGY